MDYRALGRQVKKYRLQIGLTQEKLAEKCGLSASYLGHIERGTRKASLETFVSLARVLEVTADMLLREPEIADLPKEDSLANKYVRVREAMEIISDYHESLKHNQQ